MSLTYIIVTAPLTGAKAEVIALITQGLSNHDFSDRAYLSINTVKTFIRSAYRKIDVTTRSAATSFAVKSGLI